MRILRLWLAALTHDRPESGTDGVLRLQLRRGDAMFFDGALDAAPGAARPRRSEANLYRLDLEGGVEVGDPATLDVVLTNDSRDLWKPEHIVVWGEVSSPFGTRVEPLAASLEIALDRGISADAGEGLPAKRLDSIQGRDHEARIDSLYLLIETAGSDPDSGIIGADAPLTVTGSKSPIELQIVVDRHLAALFEFRRATQPHLRPGRANFFVAPVIVPFTKRELAPESITLRLRGTDNWAPNSVFLFGARTQGDRLLEFRPLTYLPQWPMGIMNVDAASGVAEVTLPLFDEQTIDGGSTGPVTTSQLVELLDGQRDLRDTLHALTKAVSKIAR